MCQSHWTDSLCMWTAGPSSAQGRGSQFGPPAAPTVTLQPPPLSAANSPMRPPPSPIRNAALGQGPIPVGAHAKGVSLMEAGNWDAAVKAFGQALDNARGDTCTKEAQYLAAVMLLKVCCNACCALLGFAALVIRTAYPVTACNMFAARLGAKLCISSMS